MENWKRILSIIVGSVFMIIPCYQVIMFGLLLTEKINYTFISFCLVIALIAFYGVLKDVAKSFQDKYFGVSKYKKNNTTSAKDDNGKGAVTPDEGF